MSKIGPTFRTAEPLLQALLEDIHIGTTQLPDFQRGWVWDDHRIARLLASLSLSYPIGAVMLMETGGAGVNFAPRLVQGVTMTPSSVPARLILDGQQRLTSLYLALRSGKAVATTTDKKQPITRFYYVDMAKALDDEIDRVDAILSLPEDRIVRSDFNRKIDLDVSTAEHEYDLGLFPLALMFDAVKFGQWKMGYGEHHGYAKDRMRFLHQSSRTCGCAFSSTRSQLSSCSKGRPRKRSAKSSRT
jgi:hypothetical protein